MGPIGVQELLMIIAVAVAFSPPGTFRNSAGRRGRPPRSFGQSERLSKIRKKNSTWSSRRAWSSDSVGPACSGLALSR